VIFHCHVSEKRSVKNQSGQIFVTLQESQEKHIKHQKAKAAMEKDGCQNPGGWEMLKKPLMKILHI